MIDLTIRRHIMLASLDDMAGKLAAEINAAPDGAALDEIGGRLEDLSKLLAPRPG